MAQTLLSGNIDVVYDKLLFRKADGKVYYTNIAGDADVLMFGVLEDTALSTWAGTSNITTLGTVTTGTWNATTIAVNQGGSGQTSYTNGQLLIGNTSGNTLAKGVITGTANEVDVTLGGGTIQVGLPNDVTVTGDLTVTGNKITFGNGGIVEQETDAGILEFKGESVYLFRANSSNPLKMVLVANNGGISADTTSITVAAGGGLTVNSPVETERFKITTDGKIKLGGNVIQNLSLIHI